MRQGVYDARWAAAAIATMGLLVAGYTIGYQKSGKTCSGNPSNIIELHGKMIAELESGLRGVTLAQKTNATQNHQVITLVDSMRHQIGTMISMAETIERKLEEHEQTHEHADQEETGY